jgi:hypothetical protein
MSPAMNEIEIDSAVGDISLSTISTPAYQGRLLQANLILLVQEVRNSAAGLNNINGLQQIQFKGDDLTYRDAIRIPSGTFYFTAADILGGQFRFQGSVDLKDYISPSKTYEVKWEDADASADSLWLYGTQLILRLYYE